MARALRRALLPLILSTLFLALADSLPARADGSGVLEGQLVNGTPGGQVPAEQEMTLVIFRDSLFLEEQTAMADASGHFRFEGLETAPEYVYYVFVLYQGVAYGTEAIRLEAPEPQGPVELRIYEANPEDPGLRALRALVLLEKVDRSAQTLTVLELQLLENPTERTFLPRSEGAEGPMGLLRFALPPGAGSLRPGLGLEQAQIIEVDRGFASTLAVRPGPTEVGFSYLIPYQRDRYTFERSLPYDLGALWVLAPERGPRVEGPSLALNDRLTLGETTYWLFTAEGLPKGSRVEFTVSGLPTRLPWASLFLWVPAPVWGGLVAGVALAVAMGYALVLRRARHLGSPSQSEPLLEALRELEERFTVGALPEEEYRRQRAEYKRALVDRWLEQGGPESDATAPSTAEGEPRRRREPRA